MRRRLMRGAEGQGRRAKLPFNPVTGILAAVALLALGLFVAPLTTTANVARDTSPYGVAVGTPMAHAVQALDHSGQQRDYDSLKHRRGLVIMFSRSLDW